MEELCQWIKKVGRMRRRHLEGILAYFDHGITNAVSEGVNSVIQSFKRKTHELRYMKSFIMTIYMATGKLKLAVPIPY